MTDMYAMKEATEASMTKAGEYKMT